MIWFNVKRLLHFSRLILFYGWGKRKEMWTLAGAYAGLISIEKYKRDMR